MLFSDGQCLYWACLSVAAACDWNSWEFMLSGRGHLELVVVVVAAAAVVIVVATVVVAFCSYTDAGVLQVVGGCGSVRRCKTSGFIIQFL